MLSPMWRQGSSKVMDLTKSREFDFYEEKKASRADIMSRHARFNYDPLDILIQEAEKKEAEKAKHWGPTKYFQHFFTSFGQSKKGQRKVNIIAITTKRKKKSQVPTTRHSEDVRRLLREHLHAMIATGLVSEYIFTKQKLGFSIIVARYGANGRKFIVVEDIKPDCEHYPHQVDGIKPSDELIAVNDQLVVDPTQDSFVDLQKNILKQKRPLKLTFIHGERRAESFLELEERRKMNAHDRQFPVTISPLRTQAESCANAVDNFLEAVQLAAKVGDFSDAAISAKRAQDAATICAGLLLQAKQRQSNTLYLGHEHEVRRTTRLVETYATRAAAHAKKAEALSQGTAPASTPEHATEESTKDEKSCVHEGMPIADTKEEADNETFVSEHDTSHIDSVQEVPASIENERASEASEDEIFFGGEEEDETAASVCSQAESDSADVAIVPEEMFTAEISIEQEESTLWPPPPPEELMILPAIQLENERASAAVAKATLKEVKYEGRMSVERVSEMWLQMQVLETDSNEQSHADRDSVQGRDSVGAFLGSLWSNSAASDNGDNEEANVLSRASDYVGSIFTPSELDEDRKDKSVKEKESGKAFAERGSITNRFSVHEVLPEDEVLDTPEENTLSEIEDDDDEDDAVDMAGCGSRLSTLSMVGRDSLRDSSLLRWAAASAVIAMDSQADNAEGMKLRGRAKSYAHEASRALDDARSNIVIHREGKPQHRSSLFMSFGADWQIDALNNASAAVNRASTAATKISTLTENAKARIQRARGKKDIEKAKETYKLVSEYATQAKSDADEAEKLFGETRLIKIKSPKHSRNKLLSEEAREKNDAKPHDNSENSGIVQSITPEDGDDSPDSICSSSSHVHDAET